MTHVDDAAAQRAPKSPPLPLETPLASSPFITKMAIDSKARQEEIKGNHHPEVTIDTNDIVSGERGFDTNNGSIHVDKQVTSHTDHEARIRKTPLFPLLVFLPITVCLLSFCVKKRFSGAV